MTTTKRKKTLRQEIDRLHRFTKTDAKLWQERNQATEEMIQAVEARLEQRIEDLEHDNRLFQLMTGGAWKTSKGEVLMIRQMSDGHLEQAIAWIDEQQASLKTMRYAKGRANMVAEQERRKRDLEHRAQAEAKKETLDKLRERRLLGRPIDSVVIDEILPESTRRSSGLSERAIRHAVDLFLVGKCASILYQTGELGLAHGLVKAELRKRGVSTEGMVAGGTYLKRSEEERAATIYFTVHRHTVPMNNLQFEDDAKRSPIVKFPMSGEPIIYDAKEVEAAKQEAARIQELLKHMKENPRVGDLFGLGINANHTKPVPAFVVTKVRYRRIGTTMATCYVEGRVLENECGGISGHPPGSTIEWKGVDTWARTKWVLVGRGAA